MTQRDPKAYLGDIVLAARKAVSAAEGMAFPEFAQSSLHQDAACYAIIVIGEASTHIREYLEEEVPDIAWQECIGMRNQLAHGYFSVNLDIVWNTVRNDLPTLLERLEPLVPDM